MLVKENGTSCAWIAAQNGHLDVLRWLHEACGKDVLMLSSDRGVSALCGAIGNKDMCMLLVQLGGLELVSAKDAAGWAFPHRLVYGGDDALACEIASVSQGEAFLDMARREVAEYDAARQGGSLVVHRGFPSDLRMDHAERAIDFVGGGFTTVRSQIMCPAGSRGYFELEVISMSASPQFGFASSGFPAIRGKSGDGVGDDSSSWAVDGAKKLKWHGGRNKWDCGWRDGDVIGLACDLVEGKLHVSLNGDFSAPNGCVFEIDVEECSGLFAAFSASSGKVRYNLGEAAFKHGAPAGCDYTAFRDFPPGP